MPPATAFLSYTRTDDDFHGGYITSFRKMLENAVHVVTGEKTFRVFQDVEGIVIGEQWEKKLSDVIHESSFFVPMLTPLFFNSDPCREETSQFLAHERTLERNDLILPIYFFTSPKLEKEEERSKDPLAVELARRQLFDWRTRADIPLDQPAARKSICELAGQIAERLDDLTTREPELPSRPVTPARPGGVPAPAASPGSDARALRGRYEAAAADPHLAEGISGNWQRQQPQPRKVLWADDNPDNNIWERRALESYGMQFVLALDTDAAERALRTEGPFSAVVSDLGRADDAQAGLTLLKRMRDAGIMTPYFIYTTRRAATLLGPVARLRGAQGITADPDALVQMVVAATREA